MRFLYRVMFNVDSDFAGTVNVWTRGQSAPGAQIIDFGAARLGTSPDRATVDRILRGHEPPLVRATGWRFHPSVATGMPFWWSDCDVVDEREEVTA